MSNKASILISFCTSAAACSFLSSPNVVIAPADLDAGRPGHQLGAVGGEVVVTLSSLAHEMVDVMVDSAEGSSSGMATVSFLNVPPVASQVVLGPVNPTSC